MEKESKDKKDHAKREFQYTLEEITIMKLMEEIMEYDQEIKMKQRWINTRMNMLHNLIPN